MERYNFLIYLSVKQANKSLICALESKRRKSKIKCLWSVDFSSQVLWKTPTKCHNVRMASTWVFFFPSKEHFLETDRNKKVQWMLISFVQHYCHICIFIEIEFRCSLAFVRLCPLEMCLQDMYIFKKTNMFLTQEEIQNQSG